MCVQQENKDAPDLKARFEFLIKARNFHYENFSKWMTYFYVAISAFFIAFYTIESKSKEDIPDKFFFEITLLCLGYVVSILWYWSSKGYYYWHVHYVSMVNHYETEVFKWPKEQRIYNVFYDKSQQNNYLSPIMGANISTSKIAILFAFLISIFWGLILFYKIISCFLCCTFCIIILSLISSIATILISSVTISKDFLFSRIKDFPQIVAQKANEE